MLQLVPLRMDSWELKPRKMLGTLKSCFSSAVSWGGREGGREGGRGGGGQGGKEFSNPGMVTKSPRSRGINIGYEHSPDCA